MAQYSAPAVLTTPWGTITFNGGTAPYYFIDPTDCTGLDMAPIRAPMDEKPRTAGGLVHDFLFGARHVVLGGMLVATSDGDRQTLEDNLTLALTSILTANGTYAWTPTGLASRTITVRCDVPASFPGASQKRFIFGLLAASPTVS